MAEFLAEAYVDDVLSGRRVECRWVRLACERHRRDRWAWERLCDARPDLAEAVAVAVAGGTEPKVIRRFVSDRTRRPELSNWVEQAARWLAAEGDET